MRTRILITVVCGLLLLSACGESIDPVQAATPVEPVAPVSPGPGIPLPEPEIAPPSSQPSVARNPFPAFDVQAAWKAELQADCAKDDPIATVASFDMTGDGNPERICWRVLKAPPVGEYLDIVVVHEGARRQSAYLLLPADGSVQVAVCPSGSYAVKADEWTVADRREVYGIPDDWPRKGLTIIDNECDPVHLFWPNDADSYGDTDVPFFFARM